MAGGWVVSAVRARARLRQSVRNSERAHVLALVKSSRPEGMSFMTGSHCAVPVYQPTAPSGVTLLGPLASPSVDEPRP